MYLGTHLHPLPLLSRLKIVVPINSFQKLSFKKYTKFSKLTISGSSYELNFS